MDTLVADTPPGIHDKLFCSLNITASSLNDRRVSLVSFEVAFLSALPLPIFLINTYELLLST